MHTRRVFVSALKCRDKVLDTYVRMITLIDVCTTVLLLKVLLFLFLIQKLSQLFILQVTKLGGILGTRLVVAYSN